MSHQGLDEEPLTLKIFSVGHGMEPKDFWGRSFARGIKGIWVYPGYLNHLEPYGCLVRTGFGASRNYNKIKEPDQMNEAAIK